MLGTGNIDSDEKHRLNLSPVASSVPSDWWTLEHIFMYFVLEHIFMNLDIICQGYLDSRV